MLDLRKEYKKRIDDHINIYNLMHTPIKENWFGELLIKLKLKKRKYKVQKYDFLGVETIKPWEVENDKDIKTNKTI